MSNLKKWFNKNILKKKETVYKVTYKYTTQSGREEELVIRVIESNKVKAKYKADDLVISKIAYKDNIKFVKIREE